MMMKRRTLLAGATTLAGAAALRRAEAQAQSGPIRLGFINIMSGSQLIWAGGLNTGAEIARDVINKAGGVMGRQVEIVFRDDHASPNDAVAAMREMAGSGVNLMMGTPFTSSALAVAPIAPTLGVTYLVAGSANLAFTHEQFNKNVFALGENDFISRRTQGRLMAEKYPNVTRWGALIPDVAAGHAGWQFFAMGLREGHEAAGRKVEIFDAVATKPGTPDLRPAISNLMSTPIEGLFWLQLGADAISFLQQGRPLGLWNKLKVNTEFATGPDIGRTLKTNTPENTWCHVHWYYKLYGSNAVGAELAREFTARTKEDFASPYSFLGHNAVFAMTAAIRKAGSTETPAVIAALEGLEWDSAKGKMTMRAADHQGLGRVNFIKLGPTADSWEVKDSAEYVAADAANPATPGVAFKV